MNLVLSCDRRRRLAALNISFHFPLSFPFLLLYLNALYSVSVLFLSLPFSLLNPFFPYKIFISILGTAQKDESKRRIRKRNSRNCCLVPVSRSWTSVLEILSAMSSQCVGSNSSHKTDWGIKNRGEERKGNIVFFRLYSSFSLSSAPPEKEGSGSVVRSSGGEGEGRSRRAAAAAAAIQDLLLLFLFFFAFYRRCLMEISLLLSVGGPPLGFSGLLFLIFLLLRSVFSLAFWVVYECRSGQRNVVAGRKKEGENIRNDTRSSGSYSWVDRNEWDCLLVYFYVCLSVCGGPGNGKELLYCWFCKFKLFQFS